MPLHLGWNRTVDPASDEFDSRWRRQNRPSCRLLHDVIATTGTCSQAALDANIEHGASIYPSRWDGGESYTLAGVGSIPTSGTSQWVVQIRSGGRSSGCKPDPSGHEVRFHPRPTISTSITQQARATPLKR
jgi:hypothetical protein